MFQLTLGGFTQAEAPDQESAEALAVTMSQETFPSRNVYVYSPGREQLVATYLDDVKVES